jgi:hypothetical protein
MPKYEIILYWNDEDRVFVAELPELPGCMAHGDTEESALIPFGIFSAQYWQKILKGRRIK